MFTKDLLAGRAALVTGGGTGICRGIALAFAAHGCDVAITSRQAEHLEPTAAKSDTRRPRLRLAGRRARRRRCAARGRRATEAFGRLDIVVNGAAGNFLCRAEACRRMASAPSSTST